VVDFLEGDPSRWRCAQRIGDTALSREICRSECGHQQPDAATVHANDARVPLELRPSGTAHALYTIHYLIHYVHQILANDEAIDKGGKAGFARTDPAVVAKYMAPNILKRVGKIRDDMEECVASMEEVDCDKNSSFVWQGTCSSLPLDYYLVAAVNQLSALLEY
jgi:hypothetical protein